MLLFKGETIKVKVTQNVLSEIIRLTNVDYSGVIGLAAKDPMGWMRDVLYCSLKIYDPKILGEMSVYDVGDEFFNLSTKETTQFMKDLMEDLVVENKKRGVKKVASEKK